jgi:hypothetical protein
MYKNESSGYRSLPFNSPSSVKINPKITNLFLSRLKEEKEKCERNAINIEGGVCRVAFLLYPVSVCLSTSLESL